MHSLFECYVFSHTSEVGINLLEYDNKEEHLKFYLFCMFSDYVMSCSYSETKDVIQAIISFFGLVAATSFDLL